MGQISRKLATRFNRGGKLLRQLQKRTDEVQKCTDMTSDPVHSAYVSAQNLASIFAECVSTLPEFNSYFETVAAAEEEYMPSGPPWSPLTRSYFTTWAFFDFQIDRDLETVGTCLLDVGEYLGIDPRMFTTIRQLQESRMGIYEHCGTAESKCRLRELVTGEGFTCHPTSGYGGKEGELWYVRLCPPILGFDYSVVFTTPYILCLTTRAEWTAYLKKSLSGIREADTREKLHHLMKYGRYVNGWNEFIFQAYCGHQRNAIFLAGLPDVKGSLPHSDTRPCG